MRLQITERFQQILGQLPWGAGDDPWSSPTIEKWSRKLYLTLGTAAWNTKSVMGIVSEFVAVTIMDTTLDGLPAGTFWNAKSIFKPLLSNAVIEGKPIQREDKLQFRTSLIDCKLYYS